MLLRICFFFAVSKSASTEKRDFMSPIASGDEDTSEEINTGSSNISPPSSSIPKAMHSRSVDGRQDEKEAQRDRLAKSALNYGTIGYLPSEGIFLEFPLDEPQQQQQSYGPGGLFSGMADNSVEDDGDDRNSNRLDFLRTRLENALEQNQNHQRNQNDAAIRQRNLLRRSSYPSRFFSSPSLSSGSQSSKFQSLHSYKKY